MKRSCLALLFFLAVAAAREKESINEVLGAFNEGVRDFAFPASIMRGVSTLDLIDELSNAAAGVLKNNLKEFDRRIDMLQRAGTDSIREATNLLIEKLSHFSYSSRPYLLNDDLKKINELLREMNEADPQIDRYIMPKIRKSEKELIETFEGNDSSSEIFKNLPNLVVRNMKSIIPLFHNILLTGLENAVPKITEFNNELRSEHLHGKLIPAFLEQIEKIDRRKSQIVKYVSGETWADYNTLRGIFLSKVKN